MIYRNEDYKKIKEIAASILDACLILNKLDKNRYHQFRKNLMDRESVDYWSPYLKRALKGDHMLINIKNKTIYMRMAEQKPLINLEIPMEMLIRKYAKNPTRIINE